MKRKPFIFEICGFFLNNKILNGSLWGYLKEAETLAQLPSESVRAERGHCRNGGGASLGSDAETVRGQGTRQRGAAPRAP